jgi:hypothetical protein
MPETAKWITKRREMYGKDYVNDCIRRSLDGEPGFFFAIEAGHVIGTPFAPSHPIHDMQRLAVLTGTAFAGFIRIPEGSEDEAY